MNYVDEITIGNKKQIGSTCNIEKRMSRHLNALENNLHWNSFMQCAYNKYNNFTYTILSEWKTRQHAYIEEQKLLNEFFGKDGYMMLSSKAKGADPKADYLRKKGEYKHSEEAIKKISDANKNRKVTEETRKKLSEAHIGKKKSEETKQKMKGPKSDKMKESMSIYAKNRSDSHRQNLSKANKEKKLSDDTKKKISKSQKGISKLANAKRVYQYNIKGELIAEFESVAKAAKVLRLSTSAISNAATGKSKSSAGFIWKYKN